ncbi:MAG: PQQ-binding-like beta-propeller repeat protein [Kofleriaceae bacterium]
MRGLALAGAWTTVVVATILMVYPELLHGGTRASPFARALHPITRLPIHGPAFVEAAALTPTSFQSRGTPEHRGVANSSIDAEGLLLAFEHRGENVGIHDASKASPAVDASGIYVGFDTGRIVAFDHQGNRRWQFAVAQATRGVHATAALDGERLYLGAYNGTLYALDKRTGAVAWVVRLGDTIGSSVTIVDDALYVAVETFAPPDGFVAKLDRRTGRVRWLSGWLGEQAHSTPTVDRANGLVFVGANNRTVRALSVVDGTTRWQITTDGAVKGTLALTAGVLYFGTMGGTLHAVEATTGTIRWRRPLGGRTRSSATIVPTSGRDSQLVVIGADDGSLTAFEPIRGEVRWSLATSHRPYPGSATAVRDPVRGWLVLAPCAAKTLCAIEAGTGAVVRRFALEADLTGAATVWDRSVYLVSDRGGGLARLAPRTFAAP